MGKRKSKRKAPPTRKAEKLPDRFDCPLCGHLAMEVQMIRKEHKGRLFCRVCQTCYEMNTTPLDEPVDVFSNWLDQFQEGQFDGGYGAGGYGGAGPGKKQYPEGEPEFRAAEPAGPKRRRLGGPGARGRRGSTDADMEAEAEAELAAEEAADFSDVQSEEDFFGGAEDDEGEEDRAGIGGGDFVGERSKKRSSTTARGGVRESVSSASGVPGGGRGGVIDESTGGVIEDAELEDDLDGSFGPSGAELEADELGNTQVPAGRLRRTAAWGESDNDD